MHIIGFNAMKALEWCKLIELFRTRLAYAKTSVSLRLNAFLAKTTLDALKRIISR